MTVIALFAFSFPTLMVFALIAARSHQNKVQDWLPADFPETRELAEFRKHFASDQFVVVSWKGCCIGGNPDLEDSPPDDPRIDKLAQLLMGESEKTSTAIPTDDISDSASPTSDPAAGNDEVVDPQNSGQLSAARVAVTDLENLKRELPQYIGGVTTARGVLNRMTESDQPIEYSLAVKRLVGTLLGPDGSRSCVVVFLSDKALGSFEKVLSRRTPVGGLKMVSPDGLLFQAMRAVGIDTDTAAIGGPPIGCGG